MATVYTWHATGSTETIEGLSVDGRGPAREQLADARGSSREQLADGRVASREPFSDARSQETKLPSDGDGRGSARERSNEARGSARERSGEARGSARERSNEARAGARERIDNEARALAHERADAERPSAEVPDWSREYCVPTEWNPSRQLLRALRDYKSARERGGALGLVRRKVAALRHRFWSVMTGAEIPLNSSRIEGGLLIPHPNGIVIHPEVVIGPNCLLFQQVTLGTGPRPGVPKLGGNIDVGPGAKILGGVSIGDHAIIGANAVVLNDVAPGTVVVGVPAMPKKMPARQRDG